MKAEPDPDTTTTLLRTYDAAWRGFVTWCEIHGQVPLPAPEEVVARYIEDRARNTGSAELAWDLAAITAAHRLKDLDSPTESKAVKRAMKSVGRGVKREISGTLPPISSPGTGLHKYAKEMDLFKQRTGPYLAL